MGTEKKLNNSYSEHTSTGGNGIPNVIKDSAQKNCKTALGNHINHGINGAAKVRDEIHIGKENGCSNGATLNKNGAPSRVVPFIPIHIDEEHVVEGATEVLKVIRPHWNLNAVQFKKFTDGITNKLVGCFYTDTDAKATSNGAQTNSNGSSHSNTASGFNNGNNTTNEQNDSNEQEQEKEEGEEKAETNSKATCSTQTQSNVVLVRVYGKKTDLLIDRKAERRNIELMHSYGFAPSLYATFKNGLAYDYVPGVTLNTQSVMQPEVWQLVARRMAEMHRLVAVNPTTDTPKVPMLWKKTQAFFDLVPERFSDAEKHERLEGTFLPITRLREEFAMLYQRLEKLDSPLVFAHNDLLLGNVVYTEAQQTVTFIDYEYADFNFQAFDIGNHFAEFAGVDEVDYARYPQPEFQLEWLRVYLQSYLNRAQITDDEVQRLYVQVNQFALAAHFFWTIWSLLQAEHSSIDFDYAGYAFIRYNEYLARKDEFLALDISSSKSS